VKKQKTKVVIRKLGQHRAWGMAHYIDNKIEIDTKITGYRYLLYMLHEHFHLKHPDWSETKVEQESRKTARFLWDNGFRWVDLSIK